MALLPPMKQLIDEFQIICDPDNGQLYTVTIHTTHESVVRAVEVLHFVLGVSDRIRHAMGNTASQVRADAKLKLHEAQHKSLARRYYEHRHLGVKHRAALALVMGTDLAKTLHYTSADVAACIKAYPDEALVLTCEPKGENHGNGITDQTERASELGRALAHATAP